MNSMTKLALSVSALSFSATMSFAQVFTTDVIVQGSACVGLDCSTGESFGFDTIRMKENNLRLNFEDTSSSASFPSNDWTIVANDSSNGGGNYLGIQDDDAGRIPFRVEAGARANALYVEADGDIGIGTDNPAVDLTIVTGNTPTLRLEQDGSSGFTAQTFDVAANEANFFVRDVTNGSALAFRIFPGADQNSLVVAADNDIGMGVQSPSADLHIRDSAAFATMRLEASGASPNQSVDFVFTDAGAEGALRYNINDSDGYEMQLNDDGNLTIVSSETFNTFRIQADGAAPNTGADMTFTDAGGDGEYRINIDSSDGQEMSLDAAGNMTISGTLTQGSDRANKIRVVPIDTDEILEKVAALPLSEWTYKGDAAKGVRHIGPMSQDFYAAFGTGANDKGISSIDTAGVTLAAIQSLTKREQALAARIATLEALLLEK